MEKFPRESRWRAAGGGALFRCGDPPAGQEPNIAPGRYPKRAAQIRPGTGPAPGRPPAPSPHPHPIRPTPDPSDWGGSDNGVVRGDRATTTSRDHHDGGPTRRPRCDRPKWGSRMRKPMWPTTRRSRRNREREANRALLGGQNGTQRSAPPSPTKSDQVQPSPTKIVRASPTKSEPSPTTSASPTRVLLPLLLALIVASVQS